jgi:hypothetical protein
MYNGIGRALCLLLIPLNVLWGQDLTGQWQGTLTQGEDTTTFSLQLELIQDGSTLRGQARSVGADTSLQATFQVSGWVKGTDSVYIQDVQQVAPESPAWCLKLLSLKWSQSQGTPRLTGRWSAMGCDGGTIRLQRQGVRVDEKEVVLPFTPTGKWTGQLSQSDRDYGFYFTLDLEPDGRGTSYIVSEGSGGEAHHQLEWTYDTISQIITFRESRVLKRTIPDWKWCIKQARLTRQPDADAHRLTGMWEGQIEGTTNRLGRCAPGDLRLEKPILTRTIRQRIDTLDAMPALRERPIHIAQTVEVTGQNLKLFLWDNGLVDGDVVSVYLNGQRLLDQYRVRKGRAELRIKLRKGPNFLVLVADDLGSTPPSTVAVSLHDGEREHKLVIRSDQRESGAVLIKRIDW